MAIRLTDIDDLDLQLESLEGIGNIIDRVDYGVLTVAITYHMDDTYYGWDYSDDAPETDVSMVDETYYDSTPYWTDGSPYYDR